MTTTSSSVPLPVEDEPTGNDLEDAIVDYVRTYVLWHGQAKAVDKFGVSRYTLWRFLERGRLGKSLPRAVIEAVGDDPDVINAATWAMTAVRQVRRRAAARKQPLAENPGGRAATAVRRAPGYRGGTLSLRQDSRHHPAP